MALLGGEHMNRREFLRNSTIVAAAAAGNSLLTNLTVAKTQTSAAFEIQEATILQLQQGMKSGMLTARWIAETYLKRVEEIDKHGPALNSVIEVNPDALDIADALDRERKEKGPRGPLHGIPILIKDNIDTADRMMTTAG